LFRQLAEKGWSYHASAALNARARLTDRHEDALVGELMRYPEAIEAAALHRGPQILANYLRELAAEFHAFYNALPILVEDEELRSARLGLAAAVRQVLANGLGLLGVSAPESM
jgi:arginyl-tRNA synthetase